MLMGRKAKDDIIAVALGMYLKNADGVFHCYFRLAGTQFRKSAKTSDLTAANLQEA